MDCSLSGSSALHSLLQFAQIRVHCISDATQLSHPPSPASPPALFPSIRVSCSALALRITWPKYCNFSISFSNSGLISFRIDWFDLLAVQMTLKNLLQHHGLKASILQCSAIFMVQLSPICVLKKPKALTRRTFVGKVMSLLFLQGASVLISWLQSLSAVISEPPKVLFHCFHFFPFYFP